MYRNRLTSTLVGAFLVAIGVGAVSTSLLQAQDTKALVGDWSIEYERGRQIENGEVTTIMGTAKVTIVSAADSFVMTFRAGPRPDGTVPPPSTTVGRRSGDAVVFVQKQKATITMNGEAQEREITLTWSLSASGNVLSGTLAREMPAMPEPLPATPVKGTRVSG